MKKSYGKDNIRFGLCIKRQTKDKLEELASRSGLKLTKYIYAVLDNAIENNLVVSISVSLEKSQIEFKNEQH